MIVIDNKYEIGDIVYLKTDADQLARIVTSIQVFKVGELIYKLACGINESPHYDFEISKEPDLVIKTS